MSSIILLMQQGDFASNLMQCDMFLIHLLHVVVLRKIFYIWHLKRLIIDLYLMMIDVILLLYIHFSALSNSIYFSTEKS